MIHDLAKRSKGTSSPQEPAEGDIRAMQRDFPIESQNSSGSVGNRPSGKLGWGKPETRATTYLFLIPSRARKYRPGKIQT